MTEQASAQHDNNGTASEEEVEKIEAIDEIEDKEVSIQESELKKLESEAKEFKDKYLRTLAESENSRKRLQKEKQEIIKYAIENLALDMLMPIDQMQNALSHTENVSEEIKHWAVGSQMILKQFQDSLASHDIKPFHSKGDVFDPHRHEAIEMVETEDFEEGIIVEECMVGYLMGEKTIRPAKVKVAKKPQANEESNEEDATENS